VNVEESVEGSETSQKVESSQDSGKSGRGKTAFTAVSANVKVVAMLLHKFQSVKFDLPPAGWFFWLVVFGLTATVSATVGATVALMTPLSPLLISQNQGAKPKADIWSSGFQYRLARPVNILVLGIDRVLDVPDNSEKVFRGRSDTMLLLRLDPTAHSVKMLSIPRDTRVEYPGLSISKINQANADGGVTLAARVVSRTLNNVPIDRYVRVTTSAFRELVDLVGGVEVFVPEPMFYTDKTQNLYINLDQGWQTLSGEQAEQFARFRKDNKGDIGRVQRQQALLKALRQRLQTPAVLTRLPQLLRVMDKYVDTNLSLEETLALVSFSLGLEQNDFKMVLLPGRFSTPREYPASFWVIDPVGKDRIMSEYFAQNLKTPSSDISSSPDQLRIAIQNATNQPQLSQQVAQILHSKGFHNVYIVDDWPDPQRETEIIVQKGDTKAAIGLQKMLGLGKVESASIGDLKSDLTIRVGEDWRYTYKYK